MMLYIFKPKSVAQVKRKSPTQILFLMFLQAISKYHFNCNGFVFNVYTSHQQIPLTL